MPFVDLHCDTISLLLSKRQNGLSLRSGAGLEVDGENLRKSNYLLQTFALFVDLEKTDDPWAEVQALASLYREEMARNEDLFCPILSAADLDRKENKIAALLSVEEGGVCGGEVSKLDALYDLGVRLLTLTWNHPNELASPNGKPGGLTETGYAFLSRMEELGMLADVSHLGDDGFWDVCRASKRPFLATHSNARALCPHSRNLTDEMLRAIGEKGGLVGVNFYAAFLARRPISRISDILRHTRHMLDVAGPHAVALGSDFDGMGCPLELKNAGEMEKLADAMKTAGFTEQEIENVCWRNAWEFLKRVLG